MNVLAVTSLAFGLNLSPMGLPAPSGSGHLHLKGGSYQWSSLKADGRRRILAAVETEGRVPTDGGQAFGYAWLSDGGNNALVLAARMSLDEARAGSGFKTYVLDLKPPTPACRDATFEVDLAGSRQNPGYRADYRWKVSGRHLAVLDVPPGDLGNPGIEGIAAFVFNAVPAGAGQPASLCLTVVDRL
jgi:hypothetical protein